MAYKDKDKQREANRQASQRRRDRQGMTNSGMTPGIKQGMTQGVTPGAKALVDMIKDKPKRGKDIKCFADLPPDVQKTIDRMSVVDGKIDQTIKANRTAIAINYQRLFPDRYYSTGGVCTGIVTGDLLKPGDADYNGICTPEWRAERGR